MGVTAKNAGKLVGRVIILLTACGVFCLDWWSKYWALSNLILGHTRPFIPSVLKFTLTTNTGAAFSLGQEHGSIMTALATCITLAIVTFVVVRERKGDLTLLERLGLGLLLGGATGNLFDRYTTGRVTDFLEFDFMNFPVFNVADALIDVGLALVLLANIRKSSDSELQPESQEEPEESKIESDPKPDSESVSGA